MVFFEVREAVTVLLIDKERNCSKKIYGDLW